MNSNITGRAVSLVAAVISAAGGLAILLDDVVKGAAHFEIKHGITIGIVALAILAGHSVVAAWRARHVFGVLGFLVVFLAATGLVVFKSTGRQAETTFQSQAEADFAAEERARIKPLLAIEQERKRKTQDKLQADCVDGKKGKGHCDGLRTTLGVYTMAVKGYEADLSKFGVPKPVAPEAENFANLAAVFGADKAKVKAGALLLVPFLTTALFEFGAIVGFAFAFRHRKPATGATQAPATPATGVTAADQSDFGLVADHPALLRSDKAGKPGNWGNGGASVIGFPKTPRNPGNPGNRPSSRQAFEQDVVTRLALGQSIDRQDELADSHGVHKGTASKWLKQMREDGLIPASQRIGRCHRLVAAE